MFVTPTKHQKLGCILNFVLAICCSFIISLHPDSVYAAANATLTGSTVGSGAITATVGGTTTTITNSSWLVARDANATFTFTPAAGFAVSGVTQKINNGTATTVTLSCPTGTANACTYIVADTNDDTYTITATFTAVKTVTTSISHECGGSSGGTISPSGTVSVSSGTTSSFTIAPSAGYVIKDIKYNGSSQLVASQFSSYTFTTPVIAADATLEAVFTPIYQITASSGANGSVTPAGTSSVVCGNSLSYTITPKALASIQDVLVDTVSQGAIASYTFNNVTANHAISASFAVSTSLINEYTITPQFVQTPILPNLLLMVDNSASMYDLEFNSASCIDTSYNSAAGADYVGYFTSSAYYSYNSAKNQFEAGATLPASCTFLSSDFCVDMTGTKPNRNVTTFIAKGKFLNWLATSRLDLQKKILTGGKYDVGGQKLIAESRGCLGKRFVKIAPNTMKSAGSTEDLFNSSTNEGLTFAVRGPNSYDPDFVNKSTQGGPTRIEIYDAVFNSAGCEAAYTGWTDIMVNGATDTKMGQLQGDTTSCIGCKSGSCGTADTLKSEAYLHMIHNCYWYFKDPADPKFSNTNTLTNDCENIYSTIYPGDLTAPSKLTNDSSGDALCSSVIDHKVFRAAATGTQLLSSLDKGYLGRCATLSIAANGKTSASWNSDCLKDEMIDFCAGMKGTDVTDPSGTSTVTTTVTDLSGTPAFLADAGLNGLGSPKATYFAAVSQVSAPTGLLYEFKTYINFGAMIFNTDGSGTECDVSGTGIKCARYCSSDVSKQCLIDADCLGGSCVVNTAVQLDGAKIPDAAYIGWGTCSNNAAQNCTTDANCTSPGTCVSMGIGDHSSGLVKAIDDVVASSWTPFAEAYYNAIGYFANRTDLRINAADFNSSYAPPSETCRLNNILLITDGQSTADRNASALSLASTYGAASGSTGTCNRYAGSKNLDDLAWIAKNRNIRTFTTGTASAETAAADKKNNQNITTYVVYNSSGTTALTGDECNAYDLLNQTAVKGGTAAPYIANSYEALLQSLRDAFKKISTASASGTAASILNNSEGSGANLLQAVFYPKKVFAKDASNNDTTANWIGELQNLWYYVDPYFNKSTIRADTDQNFALNLKNDYLIKFRFDSSQNQTFVDLSQDVNGDGSNYVAQGTTTPDAINSLWAAGRRLWARNLDTNPRTIYTATGTSLRAFSTADAFSNDSSVWSLMDTTSKASTVSVVNYIHGYDASGLRSRTVRIGSDYNTWKLGDIVNSTPKIVSGLALNTYALSSPTGYNDGSYSSYTKSNNYKKHGMVFVGANDGMLHAFRMGILDVSGQTVFDKAKLKQDSNPTNLALTTAAQPTVATSTLGEEAWAFIPKNALPYLKYFSDPDYAHMFFVDNTVTPIDASIHKPTSCTSSYYWECDRKTTTASGELTLAETSWRTVLIGGMGLGGASYNKTDTCSQCVKTPVADNGYSSYFALDVTNPELLPPADGAVSFKWEFSGNPAVGDYLGYSTTGPAVVRVGNKSKNGRWLAVFASGPTGPINTANHAFQGESGQNLKLFVVDIADGTLVRTIKKFGTHAAPGADLPAEAFASSMVTSVIDTDKWNNASSGFYSDDAIYVGYTRKCVASDNVPTATCTVGTWSKGGVLRILTKENTDPDQWEVSTVIDNVGPVTTSVTKLQDRNASYDKTVPNAAKGKLWLYFGTGRYYYKNDLMPDQFRLYGVEEPCYSNNTGPSNFIASGPTNDFDTSCTKTVAVSDLQDQTGTATEAPLPALPTNKRGWYIDLPKQQNSADYGSERVITNPVATPSGAVFFTTFRPSSDLCSFLGDSYIWALGYNTGGAPPGAAMKGKALLQVSTGEIKEVSLSSQFSNTDQRYDKRRIDQPITGMPPTSQGLALIGSPKPAKKIIHIQEK